MVPKMSSCAWIIGSSGTPGLVEGSGFSTGGLVLDDVENLVVDGVEAGSHGKQWARKRTNLASSARIAQ